MADYLWRKLSELERQKIAEDAKALILEFGDTIEKLPKRKEDLVERDKFEREESEICKPDSDFRKIMFENAPNIKDDCIVAEKGKWIEI